MPNPRVLKAHREALLRALPEFLAECPDGDWNQPAADAFLFAILSARDHRVPGEGHDYVVGTRYPSGATEIYGVYQTHAAAVKAIEMGVCAHHPDATVGIFPLLPAPRAVKPSTKKVSPTR